MTALAVILAVIGLVWGTLLAVRGSLIVGCVLYLMTACCFGPYFLTFDVGVTLSLDRLLIAGLGAAYVLQRFLGQTDPKPLGAADWLLFGFLAVRSISAFIYSGRAPSGNPDDVPVLQHLINGYWIPLAVYWIARQSPVNERHARFVLAALTLFGCYLAATGILEAMGQWSLVFPRYISNPELGLHFGRARGPMVHSVSFGMYLAAGLLALWLWREQLAPLGQLVLFAIIPAFAAAVFFTKTRTVWLGAATGVVLLLANTLKGRLRTAVLGSMIAAAILTGVTNIDTIMGLKREGTVQDTRKSASMRASFAYVSWLMFKDRPIFGFGFGQFAHEKLAYLGDRDVDLQLESIRDYVHHNTYLSILTETGLVGLSLFLAVLIAWTRMGVCLVRLRDGPLWARRQGLLLLGVLGIAAWQMIGHEITFTPLDNSLIYFTAGLTAGAWRRIETPPPELAACGGNESVSGALREYR